MLYLVVRSEFDRLQPQDPALAHWRQCFQYAYLLLLVSRNSCGIGIGIGAVSSTLSLALLGCVS